MTSKEEGNSERQNSVEMGCSCIRALVRTAASNVTKFVRYSDKKRTWRPRLKSATDDSMNKIWFLGWLANFQDNFKPSLKRCEIKFIFNLQAFIIEKISFFNSSEIF